MALRAKAPHSGCTELEALSVDDALDTQDAKVRLRNAAGEAGADVVVLDALTAEPVYYPGTKMLATAFIAKGRAYECRPALADASF